MTADPEDYRAIVDLVVDGLTSRPAALFDPSAHRMSELAASRRYEEAALVRDRAAALAGALRRQRRVAMLQTLGDTCGSGCPGARWPN